MAVRFGAAGLAARFAAAASCALLSLAARRAASSASIAGMRAAAAACCALVPVRPSRSAFSCRTANAASSMAGSLATSMSFPGCLGGWTLASRAAAGPRCRAGGSDRLGSTAAEGATTAAAGPDRCSSTPLYGDAKGRLPPPPRTPRCALRVAVALRSGRLTGRRDLNCAGRTRIYGQGAKRPILASAQSPRPIPAGRCIPRAMN